MSTACAVKPSCTAALHDVDRCVSGLNCLAQRGPRDGFACAGRFRIDQQFVVALKDDASKGLFSLARQSLQSGSKICPGQDVADYFLIGIKSAQAARDRAGARIPITERGMAHEPLDEPTRMQVVQNYLFNQLKPAELSTVLRQARVRRFAPAEAVFSQGDPAAHFFLVVAGQVRLYRVAPHGEEKVIELIGPGALFAEAVSFMGGRYPVHAAAVDHVRLVSFAFEDLNRALEESPGLAFRMMGSMAMRIHGLVNEIDHLASGSAGQRLIYYLIDLLRDAPDSRRIHLRAPKHVIASRIGVKPETLSRLLARLKEAGILDVQEDWLVVHDDARLKAVLQNPATLF